MEADGEDGVAIGGFYSREGGGGSGRWSRLSIVWGKVATAWHCGDGGIPLAQGLALARAVATLARRQALGDGGARCGVGEGPKPSGAGVAALMPEARWLGKVADTIGV